MLHTNVVVLCGPQWRHLRGRLATATSLWHPGHTMGPGRLASPTRTLRYPPIRASAPGSLVAAKSSRRIGPAQHPCSCSRLCTSPCSGRIVHKPSESAQQSNNNGAAGCLRRHRGDSSRHLPTHLAQLCFCRQPNAVVPRDLPPIAPAWFPAMMLPLRSRVAALPHSHECKSSERKALGETPDFSARATAKTVPKAECPSQVLCKLCCAGPA